jgi:hypothetical protein
MQTEKKNDFALVKRRSSAVEKTAPGAHGKSAEIRDTTKGQRK